jgi:hypothetical protein
VKPLRDWSWPEVCTASFAWVVASTTVLEASQRSLISVLWVPVLHGGHVSTPRMATTMLLVAGLPCLLPPILLAAAWLRAKRRRTSIVPPAV